MSLAPSFALVLAVVLGVAALGKLRDLPAFARQLAGYRLPPSLFPPRLTAGVVVAAEPAAAVLLLVPAWRAAGALLAAALFGAFLLAAGSVLARGLRVPCACFGGAGELETVGAATVVRTTLLLGLAVTVAVRPAGPLGLPQLLLAALVGALVLVGAELARLAALATSRSEGVVS